MGRRAAIGMIALALTCSASILDPPQEPGASAGRPQNPFAQLHDPSPVSMLKTLGGKRERVNISPAEGRYLHDLITTNDLKAGLEIGTFHGYSGIWLGMALRRTGGRLLTIECDSLRAHEARKNFRKAGLQERIDLRIGDPLQEIPSLAGPFDFVFIDARKEDYGAYLEMVLPKVRPGGLIAAHNVTDQRRRMTGFIRSITEDPRLETEFEPITRAGLSISRKAAHP